VDSRLREDPSCEVGETSSSAISLFEAKPQTIFAEKEKSHKHSTKQPEGGAARSYALLVWSAFDEDSLTRMVETYKEFIRSGKLNDTDCMQKLAFTLSARRSNLSWRSFAVVANDTNHTNTTLQASAPLHSNCATVGFIFTGQGAQYARMGIDLLRYPVFIAALRRVDCAYREMGYNSSIVGT
jgi:acyl transferase domain-containing protein